MMIVRPVHAKDTQNFINLAFTAGVGMTSMPKNKALLEKKIFESQHSFAKDVERPGNEAYLFILEDVATGTIGGSCGIAAKTGIEEDKVFFTIEEAPLTSSTPNTASHISFMRPSCYRDAPSEIGSLYLLPEHRKGGLGRLLSLSRFLFAAAEAKRFESLIYAEMRGVIDSNNICPFWEGVGRHFLNMDFEALMRLRDLGTFAVKEILPQYPIYIPLLPKGVQDVIGKPHAHTQPAFHMLIQEGFYQTKDIDVFDGGPKLEAKIEDIRTIKTSRLDTICNITSDPIDSPRYILSNNRLDFRAGYSLLKQTQGGIEIPAETASALQLQIGDLVRYVLPYPPSSEPGRNKGEL